MVVPRGDLHDARWATVSRGAAAAKIDDGGQRGIRRVLALVVVHVAELPQRALAERERDAVVAAHEGVRAPRGDLPEERLGFGRRSMRHDRGRENRVLRIGY